MESVETQDTLIKIRSEIRLLREHYKWLVEKFQYWVREVELAREEIRTGCVSYMYLPGDFDRAEQGEKIEAQKIRDIRGFIKDYVKDIKKTKQQIKRYQREYSKYEREQKSNS